MNPALWAAIAAAAGSRRQETEDHLALGYEDPPKKRMPLWPRFLLWQIRKRAAKRGLTRTAETKLDTWLWAQYFEFLGKDKK